MTDTGTHPLPPPRVGQPDPAETIADVEAIAEAEKFQEWPGPNGRPG